MSSYVKEVLESISFRDDPTAIAIRKYVELFSEEDPLLTEEVRLATLKGCVDKWMN